MMALLGGMQSSLAQENLAIDTGRDSIGKLKVSLIYGTDGDINKAGKGLQLLNAERLAELNKLKAIKFTHYRLLGEDEQPILRSYENWANPMKNSKEILLSFQPRGKAANDQLKMDLEFWQSRKKIMKSGATLQKGVPLFIQGPAWRGGKVIITVELISLADGK